MTCLIAAGVKVGFVLDLYAFTERSAPVGMDKRFGVLILSVDFPLRAFRRKQASFGAAATVGIILERQI